MKITTTKPGDFHCSKDGAILVHAQDLHIVLSVFDEKKKIGALCHLPSEMWKKQLSQDKGVHCFSIVNLLKSLKKEGCQPQSLRSKIIALSSRNEHDDRLLKIQLEKISNFISNFSITIEKKIYLSSGPKTIKLLANTGEIYIKNDPSRLAPREAPRLKTSPTHREPSRPIQVMVIDDSKLMHHIIHSYFKENQRFKLLPPALNPLQALDIIEAGERPDLIILDIQMPEMDGITFLKEYHKKLDIPTIVFSSASRADADLALEAMELGAFDFIEKPSLEASTQVKNRLIKTLLMAFREARLSQSEKNNASVSHSSVSLRTDRREIKLNQYDLVLIGASTGGTKTIKDILIGVPKDCPPIVIVQHMPPVFTQAFANKLDRDLKPNVIEASDGVRLSKGTVVVAKGGFQLSLKRTAGEVMTSITDDPPINRFKPSVDYTFLAAAKLEMNQRILSILLTGMGHDGAKGLLKLKEQGQMTIAQDEASSIVYGMPKAAMQLGAANHILNVEDLMQIFS